jgi:hypothetical protein
MFHDLLTYLTTPCSPHLRRLGYLDEMIAMKRRYRRNRSAWESHLDSTRRFVLSVVEKCRNRSKAVVAGSGLLLDVPLAELSTLFNDVVLMDVICLPEVRRHIRGYRNVTFLERDVTNIAKRLFDARMQGLPILPEAAPALPGIGDDTGLLVSLNILSQLWVIPRAYAARQGPVPSEDQMDDWCRRIVESHYASLRSMTWDVCLIADYEFVKRDKEGSIFSKASTIYDLPLPEPDASWTWNIVPLGKDSRYLSKDLSVGAWHLPARTRREKDAEEGNVTAHHATLS